MITPQQRKSRQLIIGIFLLSIIPFTIAWILAKNPTLLKFSATNHGQLIVPVITSQLTDYKGFDSFSENNLREISFHWLIVNLIPHAECSSVCLDALYKSRQLRLMLNKELVRTRRVVLLMDENTSSKKSADWWKEEADLLRLNISDELKQKLNTLYSGNIPDGILLLIDPLGNVMMKYAPDFNPYDAKSDLMHLLKISQIG
jgi:hypothetical protein